MVSQISFPGCVWFLVAVLIFLVACFPSQMLGRAWRRAITVAALLGLRHKRAPRIANPVPEAQFAAGVPPHRPGLHPRTALLTPCLCHWTPMASTCTPDPAPPRSQLALCHWPPMANDIKKSTHSPSDTMSLPLDSYGKHMHAGPRSSPKLSGTLPLASYGK